MNAILLRTLGRLGRWTRAAAPVVRRGLGRGFRVAQRACGQGSGRAWRWLRRSAHHHRAALRAIGERLAWWGALGLLVLGGRPVLGPGPVPEQWLALAPFVAGLLLCAGLRLGSRAGRLRTGALGLGALHGTAAALVWAAFAG